MLRFPSGLWRGGVSSRRPSSRPPEAITVSITPSTAATATGGMVPFVATTNDPAGVTWAASAGAIDGAGNYSAPAGVQSGMATITATSVKDPSKSATATVNIVVPGQISNTPNAQVATYSISPAAPGYVSVQFGVDTNYGLSTWSQPVPPAGGNVSLFVAGMKGNTVYHLRGVIQFLDGSKFIDSDQTFTTGAPPAAQVPSLTATTSTGMTPQGGVELVNLIGTTSMTDQVAVADLDGNLLWSFNYNPGFPMIANPIKLLHNGHFLINFSQPGGEDGASSVLEEIDLTGSVIWKMSSVDLNKALAAATCSGCNITVAGTHHDFVLLPNGHLIVIASLRIHLRNECNRRRDNRLRRESQSRLGLE